MSDTCDINGADTTRETYWDFVELVLDIDIDNNHA